MCVCHLAVVQPGLGPYKNQTSEVMFLVTKLRVKQRPFNNDRLTAFDPGQPG